MTHRYYSLTNLGDHSPYGLIRQEAHRVERYVPTDDTWFEAPSDWDYLLGREPGARAVEPETADRMISSGTLADIPRPLLG